MSDETPPRETRPRISDRPTGRWNVWRTGPRAWWVAPPDDAWGKCYPTHAQALAAANEKSAFFRTEIGA